MLEERLDVNASPPAFPASVITALMLPVSMFAADAISKLPEPSAAMMESVRA